MDLKSWFKRARTYDCVLVDEVDDGMPVTEGELRRLPLDGDMFVDSYYAQAYTRSRDIRPITLTIDGKRKDVYVIAKRAGAACGVAMVHIAGKVQVCELAGKTIEMKTDEMVLMLWTDPETHYHIHDSQGLKKLFQLNLAGFERVVLVLGGVVIGWLVVAPIVGVITKVVFHG